MLVFFGGAVTRFIPWPAACIYVEKLRGRTVFMSEKNVFITMCYNGYGGRFFSGGNAGGDPCECPPFVQQCGLAAIHMPQICDGLIYGIFKIDLRRRPVRVLLQAAGPGVSLICHMALVSCRNRRAGCACRISCCTNPSCAFRPLKKTVFTDDVSINLARCCAETKK